MKTALIAIDPMRLNGKEFARFCKTIEMLQTLGLFSQIRIASVIHSALFLVPNQYYRDHEDELVKETKKKIIAACRGKFEFRSAQVLKSDSSSNEELVAELSKYGHRTKADLLVVGSNDRQGLPYWFLGSVSETASLTASLPVLVVKTLESHALSQKLSVVVAIDVAAPPKSSDLRWLVDLGKSLSARIHLVYVVPEIKPFIENLQERKERHEAERILKKLIEPFHSRDVAADYSIVPEGRSIAHTLVEFAEKKDAGLTIATTAQRSRFRKLLLGSNARHVLALSRRPFLSYRSIP